MNSREYNTDFINILSGIQRRTLLTNNINIDDNIVIENSQNNDNNSDNNDKYKVKQFWLEEFGIEPHTIKYIFESEKNHDRDRLSPWPNLRNSFPSPHHHIPPLIQLTGLSSPLHLSFSTFNHPSIYHNIHSPYVVKSTSSSDEITHLDILRMKASALASVHYKQYNPLIQNNEVNWTSHYDFDLPKASRDEAENPLRPVPSAILDMLQDSIDINLPSPDQDNRITWPRDDSTSSDCSILAKSAAKLIPIDSMDGKLENERERELIYALGRHSEGVADSIMEWMFSVFLQQTQTVKNVEDGNEKNSTFRFTWEHVLTSLQAASDEIDPSRELKISEDLPTLRLSTNVMRRTQNRIVGLFQVAKLRSLKRKPAGWSKEKELEDIIENINDNWSNDSDESMESRILNQPEKKKKIGPENISYSSNKHKKNKQG